MLDGWVGPVEPRRVGGSRIWREQWLVEGEHEWVGREGEMRREKRLKKKKGKEREKEKEKLFGFCSG